MGAISQIIGAGLKKAVKKIPPKMDIKKYQDGINKRAFKHRKKQIVELKSKIATTKDPKELAKLQAQLSHVEKYAAKNKQTLGLGGTKKSMGKFEKAFKKTGKATDDKGFEKRIDKARRIVEAGAGKRKKVKSLKNAAPKRAREASKKLLDKMEEMPTFKKQAD